MKSQRIETIRKKFRNRNEWLLIAIDKMDRFTTKPTLGRLLAHSPSRDVIYKKLLRYKPRGKQIISIDYSQDTLPKDVAVIFYGNECSQEFQYQS